ncbi:AraC family transcriptional regulator [Pelagibacterium halotolerans]|uniref:AraC family transcriptional regulator n=1 Tax=Pelagibacterium halotolerans TaxID=531813 RepID=UPI00384A5811
MLNHQSFYAPPAASGTGFDAFMDTFAQFVPSTSGQIGAGKGNAFQWQLGCVASPDVTLFHMHYSADWFVSSESDYEGLKVLALFSGGAYDATVGSNNVTVVPGTALLLPMARANRFASVNGPQMSRGNLVFSSSAVKRVLSSMFGDVVLSELELAPLFNLATPAGATFYCLIHAIASGMTGERVLERSPQAMALLVESTLRFIFENVPHRLSSHLERGGFLDIAPRHIREAIDFMHANMHKSLTISEIADAAGVSVRALQTGFRQFQDMTPTAYLRQIRLQAARDELSCLDNRLPINSVALKWGFTHFGHFAARYRAAFGEYPSETVRKVQHRL